MTSIEWTNRTWNPVTGCSRISPGCANCYAATTANRFWGDRKFGEVQFHEERLLKPLTWRNPRKVFVNSMSDLFHSAVTSEQLDQIFAVMTLTQEHTYQILTKRPDRMLDYLSAQDRKLSIDAAIPSLKLSPSKIYKRFPAQTTLPLPNVWLGVSVESQKTADERISLLLQTPAAKRFLSCEPLLEAVNLQNVRIEALSEDGPGMLDPLSGNLYDGGRPAYQTNKIDWVIVGGESGSKARPCDTQWLSSIVSQCKDASVPCFVKQLGSNPLMNVYDWYDWCDEEGFERDEAVLIDWNYSDGQPPPGTLCKIPLRKGKGGDPSEWPEDLRVREFPSSLAC